MGEEEAAPAVAPSSCACSVGKDWEGGGRLNWAPSVNSRKDYLDSKL